MIEVKDVSIVYDNRIITDRISFELKAGRVMAFIGENGAGKSTTLKLLAGLIRPDGGDVLFKGESIYKDLSAYQKKVGYMPDYFGVYDNLSVIEYLNFFCDIYGIPKKKIHDVTNSLIERFGLQSYVNDNVDILSMGLKQRLGLARTLINDPDFLVLDEPMSGMDIVSKHEFKEFILDIQEEGKGIIISSHALNELSEVCTDICIIERGQIKALSDMEEIMAGINLKNPIYINVISDTEKAVALLKERPEVLSVSIDENTLMVNVKGGKRVEADVLESLIENGVKISGYTRKKGNLDMLFMKYVSEKEWQE
ncbi:MAG: ABC transporter ATP-binding protein [Lachnospiraceae bacterium]|nr:ABC transporter ATP-binding protein [Lachnospiraceae bacterium]